MSTKTPAEKKAPTEAKDGEHARQIIEQMDVRSCPVCGDWNADEDSLMMEHGGDEKTWYACCPACWYRFERIDAEDKGQ